MPSNRSWTATSAVQVTVAEASSSLLRPGHPVCSWSVATPTRTPSLRDAGHLRPSREPRAAATSGGWQRCRACPRTAASSARPSAPTATSTPSGGKDDAGDALAANEIFNASPACLQAQGALTGGTLIVDGGSAATCGWSTGAPLPTPRWDLAVVAGPDGLIYAIGGALSEGAVATRSMPTPPTPASWTSAPQLNVARRGHGAVVTSAGLIWVLGGYGADGGVLSAVEVYDPLSDGGWMRASP